MIVVQSRNNLSRGLTGEEYCKHSITFNKKGKKSDRYAHYFVNPIGAFDKDDIFLLTVSHDDDFHGRTVWEEERRILNWSGYLLMCKTKYFTSKASFRNMRKNVLHY